MLVWCSLAALLLAATPTAAAAAPPASASGEAYRLTQPHAADLLKIRGDFGLYVGRVRRIEPTGLSGFENDPQWRTGLPKPDEPLRWREITSVERRGSEATKGALIGAAVLAIPGALLFYASEDDGDFGEVTQGAFAGALTGALLGAVVGAPFQAWHRVYSR